MEYLVTQLIEELLREKIYYSYPLQEALFFILKIHVLPTCNDDPFYCSDIQKSRESMEETFKR